VSNRERLARASRRYNLVFPGDSLTAGTGASSTATQYPSVVASSYSRARSFINEGVGGETSTQIKDRVVAFNLARLSSTQIIWAGRNNYTSPTTVKADIAAMIAAFGHTRYLVLSIINGDYASEYAGEADYLTLTGLNSDLAALYGARFVDVRTPLVALGAPGGFAANPTDYARDIPPSGVRLDNVHLLDAGHAVVAAAVYAKLLANGW
jgi:lysophospholipase L1-like esterase